VGSLVDVFHRDPQTRWDLRFEFLAHCATSARDGGTAFGTWTTKTEQMATFDAVYRPKGSRLFTGDVSAFRAALGRVSVQGDEAPLVALDTALDFPWRSGADCHRVVIFLTDEPLEGSLSPEAYTSKIPQLVQKIVDRRVLLFMATPDCELYEKLAVVEKSEWEIVGSSDGLAEVDFRKLFEAIGKSVSVSFAQHVPPSSPTPLFGQDRFTGRSAVEYRGS